MLERMEKFKHSLTAFLTGALAKGRVGGILEGPSAALFAAEPTYRG